MQRGSEDQDEGLSPPRGSTQESRRTVTATASLAPALSASLIATLEDAQGIDAEESLTRDGGFLAPNSRKKQFPRGLKRLRDRLQVLDDRLRLDVNALKQQISDLRLHSTLLSTKIKVQQQKSAKEKAVETVAEYFGAFQFGWILPIGSADQDTLRRLHSSLERFDRDEETKATGRQRHEELAYQRERHGLLVDRQHQFITTALSPSMRAADQEHGLDVFVQQWQTFTRRHDGARLELTSMSCHGAIDEPIVVALGLWSGSMTRNQLQELYPIAFMDALLVQRLVGTRIQYPSREIFLFDEEGRVIRYEVELDLVAALHHVVGSLGDVECLLAAAMRR